MSVHVPVLTAEVLLFLRPARGGLFLDCTVGLGGHAKALLEAGATRVIGLDRDPQALAAARETLAPWGDRVELVHADYREFDRVLDERQIPHVDGTLADLGVSSLQLDGAGPRASASSATSRSTCGWTARRERRLRISWRRPSETELADAIYAYGEERFSRRIARAIVYARRGAADQDDRRGWPRSSAARCPPRGHQRIDPATRTFQALRIWVNRELDGLDQFLIGCRAPSARRRAPGRDLLSLARGSHRQAHAARAGPGGRRDRWRC